MPKAASEIVQSLLAGVLIYHIWCAHTKDFENIAQRSPSDGTDILFLASRKSCATSVSQPPRRRSELNRRGIQNPRLLNSHQHPSRSGDPKKILSQERCKQRQTPMCPTLLRRIEACSPKLQSPSGILRCTASSGERTGSVHTLT